MDRKLSDSDIVALVEMKVGGATFAKTAAHFNVAVATVQRHVKRAVGTPNPVPKYTHPAPRRSAPAHKPKPAPALPVIRWTQEQAEAWKADPANLPHLPSVFEKLSGWSLDDSETIEFLNPHAAELADTIAAAMRKPPVDKPV